MITKFNYKDHSIKSYAIRKLTNKECYRLMGIRDDVIRTMQSSVEEAQERVKDWDGKIKEGMAISASQQYKQAGNSIVVDVLKDIYSQLWYPKKKAIVPGTQLSLFDDDPISSCPVADNNNKKVILTTFSGYDSQLMAADALKEDHPEFDWECVGWSDIDKYACQMHNLVFPQYADKALGDITKIDWNAVKESLNGKEIDLFTYSSPCITEDSLILTKEGYKEYKYLKIGEEVLTKSNKWHKIAKKFDNGIHMTYFVGFLGMVRPIHCTLNHKFFALKKGENIPQFIELKDLEIGDYFMMPKGYSDIIGAEILSHGGVDYFLLPISNIIQAKEEHVYNMEIEEDHSYILQGCISKNCQDISQAGKQMGLKEGSGSRSALLWYVSDAIEVLKPKYLLQENVAALVSKKFMPDFQLWLQRLESLNYVNRWALINAKDHGVPQNRLRVFCLSMRKDVAFDYQFPDAVPLDKKLEDVLEEEVEDRYFLKDDAVSKFLQANDKDSAVFVQFALPPKHEDAMFLKTYLNRFMETRGGLVNETYRIGSSSQGDERYYIPYGLDELSGDEGRWFPGGILYEFE